MKTKLVTLMLAAAGIQAAFGYAEGPLARKTGAPGDTLCTDCHIGTPANGGPGSVTIILSNGPTYMGGVTQQIMVKVADPAQQRWGFQLTARLDSNSTQGQAGTLTPTDGNTQIRCDSGNFGTCKTGEVQFIEHTLSGTRLGTQLGATFTFNWTPPPAGSGSVTLYAAGNAANGNNQDTGDHIYSTSIQLAEAVTPPPPPSPVTTTVTVAPTAYVITNLVSDVPGLAAQTDPNLVNPWGIALSPTSPFWVANNGSMTGTLYNGSGAPLALVVANIGPASGQVFNPTPGFAIQPGSPSSFIFSTEGGQIIGWNGALDKTNGHVLVDNSSAGAVYKGLALGYINSSPVLYAANFHAATVDTFDSNNNPLTTTGGFTDPNMPAGFAPFNIYAVGQSLIVSYAMQDAQQHDDVRAPGNGYIDVFDMNGNLIRRLVSSGALNSPWGMAMAPAFFGTFSGTLLVGNFGDGLVNSYDLETGNWVGALPDVNGNPLATPGLWGLIFGNGTANGGDAHTLYFTAGIAGGGNLEDHGLFGSISIAPPATSGSANRVARPRTN